MLFRSTYTLSAGVGNVGYRGLQLARLDSLEVGTLKLHNVPVLIKNPPLRDAQVRETESLSPLALGYSMTVDYKKQELTMAKHLPSEPSDVVLPLRMYRLATDDIEWVNIMGMYWRGKAQVQAAHHAILTTRYKGVGETLEEIESVRPVGADAVLAVVRKRIDAFTAPDGAAIPSTQNRLTLVFRRTPDGLRLAHGANVEVNPRAARSNPAPPSPSLR